MLSSYRVRGSFSLPMPRAHQIVTTDFSRKVTIIYRSNHSNKIKNMILATYLLLMYCASLSELPDAPDIPDSNKSQ